LDAAPAPPTDAADAAFPDLLGGCEAMRQVRATIARVGASAMAVHVFGETGTGKERVAHALHSASGRRGPLVAVNAARLEDGLFESEMFGHVKGSFTGSTGDREGLVSAAHGGTLFLDEVAELSSRAQAKLLRFLETGEYLRVGETRARRADVRIVSAANAQLRERVREQRFREDLMYRLVDYTITLPPLRERGEDALVLARHFLRACAESESRPCPRLGAAAARAMLAHAWPGNVRELRKQMHRAVVLARDGVVHPEHLQLQGEGGERTRATLREARAAFERALLERRLAEHGACRSRTAVALGITRQALALKMRQYGL
jgi:DNA-binding NtrC family response regulator